MREIETQEENQEPLHIQIVKHKAFLPFLLFIGLITVFSFSSRFADRPPVIADITPDVGLPGEVLVITGDYFGENRQGGEVHIAGTRPTSSSYIEWSNTRISVRIPPQVGSGLVYVITRNGKSDGVLFTNEEHIPVLLEGPTKPGYPYIERISPTKGSIGMLVTITGLNFGFERGGSSVYFNSLKEPEKATGSTETELVGMIPACECDFNYKSWSDKEIQVYVPDGGTSGNVRVVTDRGISNAEYFEVTEPVGSKTIKQKRGYQIQYGVQVDGFIGGEDNGIYLWIPNVYQDITQGNMESTQDKEPYWDNIRGVHVYLFENLEPFTRYRISQTVWFERFSLETQINDTKISSDYTNEKLFETYTSPDLFVPSDHEKIMTLSKKIVGRERNPYTKARALYDYMLKTYSYSEDPTEKDVIKSLDAKEADSYIYAILYTALLRSSDVPARPVAGYLVYGNKNTKRHYWSEFFIEGFGWVPVDCTLGDKATFEDVPNPDQDATEFYFGNMDNQHIAFSRGIIPTIRILPDGQIVRKNRMYSLQQLYEEASAHITSYRSVWEDITIIDWW